VLALVPVASTDGPLAALVDLSLWPNDGRVRAPGARSKPGVASRPYMLNLCVAPAYRRRGLARALLDLTERVVRDVWGDSDIFLHVEDDKAPANALYEAMGYAPVKYVYDPEFPYTKEEAKVLRNVTYRRKRLPPPSPSAPVLQPPEPAVEDEAGEEEARLEEAEAAEEIDEGADEVSRQAEDEEDYSWVKQLIK